MSGPIVLSTWSFGTVANAAAWPVLAAGGSALDAVVAGSTAVELDESVDSVGVGGLPDRTGRVSLDACVMEGPRRCGSVCYVRRYAQAAQLARLVMERTQHVMLAGEGAERFAASQGMEPTELLTDAARAKWERWRAQYPATAADDTVRWRPSANIEEEYGGAVVDPNKYHDTVGVLALDRSGRLAGACTTSGMAYKVAGRVGDSPIIGAGLYVHPRYGAAVATGTGELAMGVCATHLAVERMRGGASAADAARTVIERIAEEYDVRPEHQLAVITLTGDGEWSTASLRGGFTAAVRDGGGERAKVAPAFVAM